LLAPVQAQVAQLTDLDALQELLFLVGTAHTAREIEHYLQALS